MTVRYIIIILDLPQTNFNRESIGHLMYIFLESRRATSYDMDDIISKIHVT